MKLYKLRPWLFQRGRFDHFPLEVKLAFMQTNGIKYVVNMRPHPDPALALALGKRYIHCPIPDSPHADLQQVEHIISTLRPAVQAGSGVLVHCNAGRNRSSLVSAMLLMDLEGLSGAQAIAELRRLRPNALATPAFCDYLLNRRAHERHTGNTRPRRSR